MKRIVLAFSCVCFLGTATVQAQSILDQAKKTAGSVQNPLANSGSVANSILGQLTPALSLTNAQQPKVLDLVTGFLKKKASILPLQQSNPSGYTSQFSGLKNGLFSKLKTLLTLSQYTKLLGLKPKTNDATNVLSQLFY
ncbi:hypothetical protein [Chitinophaga arvensicola]|uniref:DUF2780 domain-containing protein n=1 Tax=Chitinophaga arvensicola TaxID=29529 RepID=A0A1I0RM35_9BACT|nr:hypothetical protein [Chitinophaga arvensicola]SEW42152.1 hypothetical protein SAMN04488122_3073 [Chitinophaga arvensicola]